ncbi:MAG: hypothetical protein RL213_1281 [Bacteroidota bacterium]|jgi:hypothetical protein
MMKLLLLLCLTGASLFASAQRMEITSEDDSSFVFVRDSRYDDVVSRQKKENLLHQSVPGYRVQIYFGVNRPKASEVKLDFAGRFPDVPAYLTYQQPNFKVRVGDFRNRYEALQFMKSLEGLYPTVFVVPDEVKLPPLY